MMRLPHLVECYHLGPAFALWWWGDHLRGMLGDAQIRRLPRITALKLGVSPGLTVRGQEKQSTAIYGQVTH